MALTSIFGPIPVALKRPVASLLTGPALEPLQLADAKSWLKIDDSDNDLLISALITASRLAVEAASRRLLISQTWRLTLDAWPADGVVKVEIGPVQSLSALRGYDAAGVATSYDPAGFQLSRAGGPARIAPAGQNAPLTGRPFAGIELDLLIGYGPNPTDVPQPLRQAMLLLIALWFENRGDSMGNDKAQALPPEVEALIAPFKRPRI